MKIPKALIGLLFLIHFSFLPGHCQKQLGKEEVLADLSYLVDELRAKHQGLYLHVSQEVTDRKMDSILLTVGEGMNTVEVFQQVNALIALTHEGHTNAYLPLGTQFKLGSSATFLPLRIQFWDKQAIIHQYYGTAPTSLKRGMQLVSIDGKPVDEMVEELLPYIATDGFNRTSAYQWLGDLFPFIYRIFYGPRDTFSIGVQTYGSGVVQQVELQAIKAKQGNYKRARWNEPVFENTPIGFEIISDTLAYLAINSFSISPKKFGPWLKNRFREMAQKEVKHLILDVQDNGGGEEGNENLLMAYLMDSSFQKYRFVSMKKDLYLKNARSKSFVKDKWALPEGETLAKRGAYTLRSDYFSETGHTHPDSKDIFRGKVYVLIGGVTFSGGAEFASMIKMTGRGKLIGVETGGAYEGNVSGYSRQIKLPNSKIRISLPIVHFRMEVDPATPSRGVMPDYEVPQTWEDYLNGRNSKKEFVLRQIIR